MATEAWGGWVTNCIPNDGSPKDGLKEIIRSGLSCCPEVKKLPAKYSDFCSYNGHCINVFSDTFMYAKNDCIVVCLYP